MKVGDLVMLSAHGHTLVIAHHRKGKVGIIITKTPRTILWSKDSPDENVYEIRWLDGSNPLDAFSYHRRDLKFVTRRGSKDASGGFG